MKKIIITIISTLLALFLFAGCTEADRVNQNISTQAGYFECERRITVYNARTDLVIFEAEGYMNLDNNGYNELVVTCKVGPSQYKKNYVYLNEYTMYIVEDISGTHTDPYHYKWYINSHIFPDIEIK